MTPAVGATPSPRPAGPMARRAGSARTAWPARVVRFGAVALVGVALGGRFLLGGPAAAAPTAPATIAAVQVAGTPGPAAAPATLPVGGGNGLPQLDALDVAVKSALVIGLLVVTLRILRRVQAGPRTAAARITVLETRPVGPKAQVVLVAIGAHRLVVGLTPGGMSTLADLSAADLEGDAATVPNADERGSARLLRAGRLPGSALAMAAVAPVAAFLSTLRSTGSAHR